MEAARRALLRSVGTLSTVAVSGCLFGAASDCVSSANFEMMEATTVRIVDAYATRFERLGPLDRRLATAAVEGTVPTLTVPDEEPRLRLTGEPVVVDDRVHRFTADLRESATRAGYRLRFEAGDEVDTEATPDETVAYEELPSVDERVVAYAVLNDVVAKTRGEKADPGAIGFDRTRTVVYPSDEAEADSVLVPDGEYQYLSYENLTVRITTVESRADVTARTFAIRAEEVAESTAAFARSMKTDEGVALPAASLSSDQQAIVDEAIDAEHGYDTCIDGTPSSAFRTLMAEIFGIDVQQGDPAAAGPGLVDHDGRWYLASYTVAVR